MYVAYLFSSISKAVKMLVIPSMYMEESDAVAVVVDRACMFRSTVTSLFSTLLTAVLVVVETISDAPPTIVALSEVVDE
jgi:hypothetical protein